MELKIRKRAFYIFVECIQNVNRHHYRNKSTHKRPKEIFILRENNDRFNIALGNNISKKEKPLLRTKIDKLNDLSLDALNAHYKMVLGKNVMTHKGSAGLGLIEVARKSGSKMKYGFENDHPTCSYFTIETNINETDVQYTFPEYESVHDIGLLKRFYLSHEMSLILKYKTTYFQKRNLDKLVFYLNSLGPADFFSQQRSAEWIRNIVHGLCHAGPHFNLPEKGVIFHFFIKDHKKHMTIGWPMNFTQNQYDDLQSAFYANRTNTEDQKLTSLVMSAYSLRGKTDEKIILDLISEPDQNAMLLMQIPVA